MEQKKTLTNIEYFYQDALANSNIKTCEDMKEVLKDHPSFDWEEFGKPF